MLERGDERVLRTGDSPRESAASFLADREGKKG